MYRLTASHPQSTNIRGDQAHVGEDPWDIGRPQKAIIELGQKGIINGKILDVGCGTGENAIYLASLGHEVWGVDVSARAIQIAQTKSLQRNIPITFIKCDFLETNFLHNEFDNVIDVGLFHGFVDFKRRIFVRKIWSILKEGGRYHVLCFSENGPPNPKNISQQDLRETFISGWAVEEIRKAHFETKYPLNGAHAWLASIRRLKKTL